MSKLVKLTARSVEAAAWGTEIRDTEVRGLRLRVSPKGLHTFILVVRYPGQKNASRRALQARNLKEAREEAADWKRLVRRGVDPHEEEELRPLPGALQLGHQPRLLRPRVVTLRSRQAGQAHRREAPPPTRAHRRRNPRLLARNG